MTTTHGPVATTLGPHDDPAEDRRPADPVRFLLHRVLPVAAVAATFVALARITALPLSNGDTFFHLRFGRELLEGRWSLTDPGSVTRFGTADWVPTQWLPQVVMAWLDVHGGLAAVAWFSGLQLIALATGLFLLASRRTVPLVAAGLTVVAMIACLSGMSARPQVLSYLLAAACTAAWLRAAREARVPWLLVPLTWGWATYHGMWPVGIVIGLAACAGLALDRSVERRTLARMLLVPFGSLLVAGATPVGPALYGAVLTVGSRASYFAEWGPPTFASVDGVALLLLLGTAVLVLTRTRASWTTILLVALAAGWAVYSTRTVPVAAAMLVPLTAMLTGDLLASRDRVTRTGRTVVVLAAVAALTVLALVAPRTADRPAASVSIAGLAPALDALPAGTVVLTDGPTGAMLMWAHPGLDVPISGYGDIYTDAELDDVATVKNLTPGWDDVVRGFGARVAVTGRDSSLAYALGLAGWSATDRAGDFVLLEAPADW